MVSKPVLKYLEHFKDLNNVWVCPGELFFKIYNEVYELAQNSKFYDFIEHAYPEKITLIVDVNTIRVEDPIRQIKADFSVYQIKNQMHTLRMFGKGASITVVHSPETEILEVHNTDKQTGFGVLITHVAVLLRLIKLLKEAPEIVESHRIWNKNSKVAKRSIYSYINITKRKKYVRNAPQGTHKSPIEHIRRAHIRHRMGKDGVMREIQIKATVVNKGGEQARRIKVVR